MGIALTCHLQRNKRKFGNDDRQEWSLIGKIHRESMTRRCKALFRDCYCRDVRTNQGNGHKSHNDNVGSDSVSVVDRGGVGPIVCIDGRTPQSQ